MAGFYEVLGLLPTATEEDIHTAFRQRARQLHPDKGGTLQAYHWARMAMQTLTNATRRMRYDIHLAWAREARAARAEAARKRRAETQQLSTEALFQSFGLVEGGSDGLVGELGIFPKRGLRRPMRFAAGQLGQAAQSFAVLIDWANEVGHSEEDSADDPVVADHRTPTTATKQSEDKLGTAWSTRVKGISNSKQWQAMTDGENRTMNTVTPLSHIRTRLTGVSCDSVGVIEQSLPSASTMATLATRGAVDGAGIWPSGRVISANVVVPIGPDCHTLNQLSWRVGDLPWSFAANLDGDVWTVTGFGSMLSIRSKVGQRFHVAKAAAEACVSHPDIYGNRSCVARAGQQPAVVAAGTNDVLVIWIGAESVASAKDVAILQSLIPWMAGSLYQLHSRCSWGRRVIAGSALAVRLEPLRAQQQRNAAVSVSVSGRHGQVAALHWQHAAPAFVLASGRRSPSIGLRLRASVTCRIDESAVSTSGIWPRIQDIPDDVGEEEDNHADGCFAKCLAGLWSMMFWR